MASDCNRAMNSNDSSSCFQQTVCLQDWWLIKSKKDFQGKRLAVAGLSSKEQCAVRVFSSAPITKRYDVFTVQTADGITVIIKGFINKLRTKENGFPSEVFNHFLFGFPPHWEVYAENCFEKGSTTGFVPRSNAGVSSTSNSDFDKLMMDSTRAPNQCEKAINYSDMQMSSRMESSGNAKEQNKLNHGACNESSIKVLKECEQKNVVHFSSCAEEEVNCDIGSPLSGISLDIMAEKYSSQNGGCPRSLQSFCDPSRSTALFDGSPKLLQPSGSGTHESLEHTTLLSGSEINTTTPCKAEMNNLNVTSSNSWSRAGTSLMNLRSNQNENLASKCTMNHRGNENSFPFEACESQDEENLNRSSTATAQPGQTMDTSEEIPSQSMGVVSKCQSRKSNSKWKEEQVAVNGSKIRRNKLISVPAGSVQVNNTPENISHGTRGEKTLDSPNVGLQEHYNMKVKILDDKRVKDGSHENCEDPSAYNDGKCSQIHENIITPAVIQSKNTKASVKSSTVLGMANHKNDLITAVGEKESIAQAASNSGMKSKKKLNYDSEATPTIKGTMKISIVSPESLSLKRSRSGRLLLPSLDFWRNQKAVYDEDRRITGIQDGGTVIEPPRGSNYRPWTNKRQRK